MGDQARLFEGSHSQCRQPRVPQDPELVRRDLVLPGAPVAAALAASLAAAAITTTVAAAALASTVTATIPPTTVTSPLAAASPS